MIIVMTNIHINTLYSSLIGGNLIWPPIHFIPQSKSPCAHSSPSHNFQDHTELMIGIKHMSFKTDEIIQTYAACVDFELSNEVDSIRIAVNSSNLSYSHISHIKPTESCLKYAISWRLKSLSINRDTDRFGIIRIIPNQRIGIIGKVEKHNNDYRIVPIALQHKWYNIFKLDLLHGLLIFLREGELQCQRRLNGAPVESLPLYTPLSCGYDPPDYDQQVSFNKLIKLPHKAQSTLIRQLGGMTQSQQWLQEILFLCLIMFVIALAILPVVMGHRLPVIWYWPVMVF